MNRQQRRREAAITKKPSKKTSEPMRSTKHALINGRERVITKK